MLISEASFSLRTVYITLLVYYTVSQNVRYVETWARPSLSSWYGLVFRLVEELSERMPHTHFDCSVTNMLPNLYYFFHKDDNDSLSF